MIVEVMLGLFLILSGTSSLFLGLSFLWLFGVEMGSLEEAALLAERLLAA